jgi:hypothetical protein
MRRRCIMKAFFESEVGHRRSVTHGAATFELPILYFRDDLFALFYAADAECVKAVLPSERLHPVMLSSTKSMVGIGAFNYIDTSVGPYGEVAVILPVVHAPKPPPRLIPALRESRYPGFGALVMHLPVTRIVARDAGRGEWGYTKFIADMNFILTPEYMACRMSEASQHLLTLRVARRGIALRDTKPLITYSVKDGNLIRTVIPQRGTARVCFRPKGSFLELGDHPVSNTIRSLGLSQRPFMSRYYMERSGVLPSGEIVERGVGKLDGYFGQDREGTHTVKYRAEDA